MRLEDLEAATNENLRQKVSRALQDADDPNCNLNQVEFYRAEARFYLEEIERRQDHRISRRDFWMEMGVIALILLEIIITVGLALWGGRLQSAETDKELQALGTVQTSLQKVDSDLSLMMGQLTQLNAGARQMSTAVSKSASTSLKINSVLQNQLKIVSDEQKERSEELARKPSISAFIDNVALSSAGLPFKSKTLTKTQEQSEIVIVNVGTEPLINGVLRIATDNSNVSLFVPFSLPIAKIDGQQGNGVQISLPRLGKGVHSVTEATFSYPAGTTKFTVMLTIDGDNLSLTDLGSFDVRPPK